MLKTQKETQTYSSLTGPMKKESSAFFGDYVEEIIPWANLHGLQVVTMIMVSLSKATHDQDNQPHEMCKLDGKHLHSTCTVLTNKVCTLETVVICYFRTLVL